MNGVLKLALVAAVLTIGVNGAVGQQMAAAPAKVSLAGEAIAAYTQTKTVILAAAEAMPAENFSFKPTPEIRSYGELFTHVAQAQTRLCGAVSGTPADPGTAPAAVSKDEVIAALKKSFDVCDAAYATVTEVNETEVSGTGFLHGSKLAQMQKNVAHNNEMYGQMVVYLRLKGIVPPSTALRNKK